MFSDAFQLPGSSIPDGIPRLIDQDRLEMAARPGMVRKLLPIRQDRGAVYSGGCYLFDTWDNARAFSDWVCDEFAPDGIPFMDRPVFLEASHQLWRVAGAEDFGSIDDQQQVMRFQRWSLPSAIGPDELRTKWWDGFRRSALEAGLSSAWLLAGAGRRPELAVVLAAPADVREADRADSPTLHAVERLVSPGEHVAQSSSATKVFDRTSWIYAVWHPVKHGTGAVQWPASPPLPGLPEVTLAGQRR